MTVSPSVRPHILLIIAHDLGTRLGRYGEASVGTPALDALASEGVRFTRHFATAPFCSPSRGAIITGKYPHVNGLMGLVNLGWDLPQGNLTLAQALGQAGYETYLFGLQHEVKDRERLGFHHDWRPATGNSCEAVAAGVGDFLQNRGRKGRPFYARVGFSEVHRPYEKYEPDHPDRVTVPPYLKDTPGVRQDLAMFHGSIRTMDAAIGRMLEALSSNGLWERTLVIFTTDHGIAFPRAKATLYDPGINTALIMRWPGAVGPGQVRCELLSNVDLFPTLLEAADGAAAAGLQGRSFLALLAGGAYAPRDLIFAEKNTHVGDYKRCLRTERYKYIRNYNPGPLLALPTDIEASPTRRDMGDEHLAPRPAAELYDLENDPWETENLAGEARLSTVERELGGTLDRIMEETHDPLLAGGPVRPPEEAEIMARLTGRLLEHREPGKPPG